MSIPYMPGWWDSISQNATKLAQQLPGVIQPDNVAQKRLQEMLQQNPMLLEQMSNMDDGTRRQLEQTLGFRKQSPISTLPVGAQRQQRERETKILGEIEADPRKYQDYLKRDKGIRTDTDMQKDALDMENAQQTIEFNKLNFEKLSDDVGIGKLLNAEKKRSLEKLQEYRKNNKIDTIGLVDRIATNKATNADFEMYSVISNEPGMAEALNSALEFRKIQDQQRNSLSLRTVGMQDDFLRLAMATVQNARQEYSAAASVVNDVVNKAALAKISIEEALAADKARKAMYDEALRVRNDAKTRLDMYRPLVQKGFEKFGIKLPDDPALAGEGAGTSVTVAPPDPLAQAAYAAIAERPDAEKKIRASYKAKTGKVLP